MSETSPNNHPKKNSNRRFFQHLARAFGGAILFSFPILMTMEMWFLGFYISGVRLALFTLLTVPLLVGLSYYDGFEPTSKFLDDLVDTFVAYAVGFASSAVLLLLFGVIKPEMSADEIIGKISIQAIVGSFGAMFAQSLLSSTLSKSGDEAERICQAFQIWTWYFYHLHLVWRCLKTPLFP
jgi:putative integral membrane protein (TIGR02587 family)